MKEWYQKSYIHDYVKLNRRIAPVVGDYLKESPVGLQTYYGTGVLEAGHMGAEDKYTLKLYTKC